MTDQDSSADKLLWLAAGVVALMGVAWLVIASPWSATEAELPATLALAAPPRTEEPVADLFPDEADTSPTETSPTDSGATAADPLRMARMALDAGMLIEPRAYSAWTLYGEVVDRDPGNAEDLARVHFEIEAVAHRRVVEKHGRHCHLPWSLSQSA